MPNTKQGKEIAHQVVSGGAKLTYKSKKKYMRNYINDNDQFKDKVSTATI